MREYKREIRQRANTAKYDGEREYTRIREFAYIGRVLQAS